MAYFTKTLREQKVETITLGDGVNTYGTEYTVKRTEAIDSRNVSSRNHPALSTIGGITSAFSALTTPNGAGVRNGTEIHVVDGTVWKRWDSATSALVNVATGIANAKAEFIEFNRPSDRLTLMFNGTDKKAYDGTSVIDLTQADTTRLIAVDDNRLYTLKGSNLKISALLDPTDFTTADDSDSKTIGGIEGQGTAITSYNGAKIMWSDKTMHLLYGDRYDTYQFQDPIQAGCVSHRSVVQCMGMLFFMDYGQYKSFFGGFPVDISQKVVKYLENINYAQKENIVAGVLGNYIYLSVPYGPTQTTNNLTLEYDVERKLWYPISTGYVNFVTIGEDLYGVKVNGVIEKMNTGNHTGTWYHETGVFTPTPIRPNKTLSEMWLEFELATGSTMKAEYNLSVTGGTWVDLYTFSVSTVNQKTRVKIPTNILANQERYRLKFSGTGHAKIHFLEVYERVKGR